MGKQTTFQVLGPVTAVVDGSAVALGGPKQRALLATLLLAEGTAVPRHQLVLSVWGDDPPASAAQSLQVYVHNLRKALGADRIETAGTGYLLPLEPDELDLARCTRLLDRARAASEGGRAADAADDARRALALWQGRALADLGEEPVAAAEAARLDELRLRGVRAADRRRARLGQDVELLADSSS